MQRKQTEVGDVVRVAGEVSWVVSRGLSEQVTLWAKTRMTSTAASTGASGGKTYHKEGHLGGSGG